MSLKQIKEKLNKALDKFLGDIEREDNLKGLRDLDGHFEAKKGIPTFDELIKEAEEKKAPKSPKEPTPDEKMVDEMREHNTKVLKQVLKDNPNWPKTSTNKSTTERSEDEDNKNN